MAAATSDAFCEDRHSLPELRWFWSLTVIGAHAAGIRDERACPTLEDAQAQFHANFRKWLAWAKLEEW